MACLQFTLLDPSSSSRRAAATCSNPTHPRTCPAENHHFSRPIEWPYLLHLYPFVSPGNSNSYGRLDDGVSEWFSGFSTKLVYFILGRFDKALSPSYDITITAPTRLTQSILYQLWRGYALPPSPPGTCTLIPLQNTVCENNPYQCSFITICPIVRISEDVSQNRDNLHMVVVGCYRWAYNRTCASGWLHGTGIRIKQKCWCRDWLAKCVSAE